MLLLFFIISAQAGNEVYEGDECRVAAIMPSFESLSWSVFFFTSPWEYL